MREPGTADATCIVRVWLEPGDPVLRGRVESVPGGAAVAARGVEELVAAVREELARLERLLATRPGGP
ncbi:hypothetical protein Ade02nite_14900 [Paractinoplanes deccanensis]|uniref:Uncharacterized protein n=1 Tax=Paractinoplanes deccanensis TaxID=113561 RepID=A0ABQ3XYM5_9ACTN|nr:hypothetical protein [Actinoplanes deccanensis]GID72849.1 hypothetical protein Ade02nite_14900 [Actinoplanes deccanensis]